MLLRLRTPLAILGLLAAPLALAQTAPRPGAVETAPLPPPGGAAAPGSPTPTAPAPLPAPTPPPAAQAPQVPAAPALPGATAERPTLVPTPGDPVNVDEVILPGKPAAVLAGTSTWDDGFENLKKAFQAIEAELRKAGITPAGRPVAVFVETDDMSFRYEAMVPIAAVPDGRAALNAGIRFGKTPEGKALRFVHKGPYDDIDSTYETITAYLDAKGIVVKENFVEEYVTDLADADAEIEINVFALPR
ncbi:MAG TPA: GyrI-like domain-containing protein [Beijerinckiaceae bacterium]|jgi:effector-binding domain-containing protein